MQRKIPFQPKIQKRTLKKNFLVSFRQWKMCELYTPIFRAVFVQPKLARQKKSETTPPPTTVLTRKTHLNTVHPLNSPCIELNTHRSYLIIKNHSSIKRNFFVTNICFQLQKVGLALFGLILVLSVFMATKLYIELSKWNLDYHEMYSFL